ncbi:MAG: GNAT family N-acetyltransferase [Nitrospirota bacterium]|nr:GNAT family N-acetyltransferase [Nitrospirota bacterium]
MPAENKSLAWIIEPLSKVHEHAHFSCGHESLDRYLKQQASQDARRLVAAPFVLVEGDNRKTIVGYYTLSSFGIDLGDLPLTITKKLPDYPMVPVTLLGRLAVDRLHTGKGRGEFLLVDALNRAFKQTPIIGSIAVVVEAIDEHAGNFYRHFGFIPFPTKPGHLFLPMKSVAALFAGALK